MTATPLVLHGASSPQSTLSSSKAFDDLVGIKANVVHCHFPIHYGYNPDYSPKDLVFPIELADALWKQGQLFMATLGTWNLSNQNTGWASADVVDGDYDATLHALARRIAAWRHPLFVRLDPEFNGTWSKGWYMPADLFVAMWRHIVDLFRADGATNVTWVWCPNQLDPVGSSSSTAADKLAAYYPGAEYVDWTGFDAFNGAAARSSPWQTWAQVATLTYSTLAKLAPDKPQFVREFASHDTPGGKAIWIRDALTTIPRDMPLIRGLSWFNRDDPGNPANWSLSASNGTATAYTTALKSGPYLTAPMVMPPDLVPIKPLQSAQLWGDVPPDLRAQLAEAVQLADSRAQEIYTLEDRFAAANSALTTNAQILADNLEITVALGNRATTAEHKILAWQKAHADLLGATTTTT